MSEAACVISLTAFYPLGLYQVLWINSTPASREDAQVGDCRVPCSGSGRHRRLPRFLRCPHVPQGDTTGHTRSCHYLTFCLLRFAHYETLSVSQTHHLGLHQFF